MLSFVWLDIAIGTYRFEFLCIDRFESELLLITVSLHERCLLRLAFLRA